MCLSRADYEYFSHTIEYFFIRIGLKYVSMCMFEEALYLAL